MRVLVSILGLCLPVGLLFAYVNLRVCEPEQPTSSSISNFDWTQWGGQSRDFRVSGQIGWKSIDLSWKKQIGPGHSAVLATQEAVVVCYKKDAQEIVEKLHADDGSSIWKRTCKVDYRSSIKKYDGPHSTPVLHQDKLFTVSIDGVVRCLDFATGKLDWKFSLSSVGTELPQSGYGSSPLLVGDLLIVPSLGNALPGESEYFSSSRSSPGNTPGAVAIDRHSGKLKWKTRPFRSSHSSPILVQFANQPCVIFHGMFELVGVCPLKGKILWRTTLRELAADNVSFTPLWDAARQQVLITHGYCDLGTQAISIQREGDQWTVSRAWNNPSLRIAHTNAVMVSNQLIGTNRSPNTMLVSIDLKSGKTVNLRRGFRKSNFLAMDDQFLVLEEDGRLSYASPSSTRKNGLTKVLGGTCWTVPTLLRDKIYVRDEKEIKAFHLR